MISEQIVEKLEKTKRLLREFERVLVAFSGGVDSTLLVKIARQTLGRDRVLAVAADSPSLARTELAAMQQLVDLMDVRLRVIQTEELSNPAYRANTSARCYLCKQELFTQLLGIAEEEGQAAILYGAIGDDLHEERPGASAAKAYHVRAPLQEAGLSKHEVRDLARFFGLPNWDQPQNACLSSRIPHGMEVTAEKLQQIEQAEAWLRERGFRQIRVRHLGERARIEVGHEEVARFEDPALREGVVRRFHALGFSTVGVSQAGYRRGGANHAVVEEQLLSNQQQATSDPGRERN